MNRLPLAALLLIGLGATAGAQTGGSSPKVYSADDIRRAVVNQTFKGIELSGDQRRQADSILIAFQENRRDLDRGASDCHEKLVQLYAQRDSAWVRILTRETDKAKLVAVLKKGRPPEQC